MLYNSKHCFIFFTPRRSYYYFLNVSFFVYTMIFLSTTLLQVCYLFNALTHSLDDKTVSIYKLRRTTPQTLQTMFDYLPLIHGILLSRHQTAFFLLSTHFLAFSLNFCRSSTVQGCASNGHYNIYLVVS